MNDSIFKQLEEDFEETLSSVNKVDQGGLTSLASLARKIQEEEGNIAKLEETLKEAKKKLLKLTDEDMPAVMQEVGMNKFELDDGSTVEVKPTYGASILVDNRPQAYEWLRENGYDDIIKNNVTCSFDRVTLADTPVITEDHDTYIVFFEVQGHALDTPRKFDHLPGLDLIQPINTGDTVTDR